MSHADQDQLLSIGEFARRSRLSPKALRLYDRLGLLTPAVVDPHSRYRRYRESQLLTARLIVMMRRASIPLALVAEIIAAPDKVAADLLASYWADAEQRFGFQRELVSRLQASLLSGGGASGASAAEIRQRDVPSQLVITEQRSLPVTELKHWLPDVLGRLAAEAGRLGGLAGDMFVIYHGEVNEDSDGPAEACAPVRTRTGGTREEAAHREAYIRITRAQLEFPQILSAYDTVADWVAGSGLAPAGSPREVYPSHHDVAEAAPDDVVCDIAFPVRSARDV